MWQPPTGTGIRVAPLRRGALALVLTALAPASRRGRRGGRLRLRGSLHRHRRGRPHFSWRHCALRHGAAEPRHGSTASTRATSGQRVTATRTTPSSASPTPISPAPAIRTWATCCSCPAPATCASTWRPAAPGSGYRSRFDHTSERAEPGYYAVTLRTTGTRGAHRHRRVGLQRYTFQQGAGPRAPGPALQHLRLPGQGAVVAHPHPRPTAPSPASARHAAGPRAGNCISPCASRSRSEAMRSITREKNWTTRASHRRRRNTGRTRPGGRPRPSGCSTSPPHDSAPG